MSKPHPGKDFWLAALRADGGAFRAAVAGDTPLDSRVPTCPEWTMSDLVRHLARIYGFVRRLVPRGVTDAPEQFVVPDGVDVVEVWTEEFTELLAALDAVDPDLPAWNWAPQAKKAAFWPRRMAHETAIHRWDAQMATGLAEPIETRLAVDGVSEVLDTWLPAGKRASTSDRQGMVALHATDADEVWYVRVRGTGVALLDTDTLLDDDDRHERVTASGPASDLMLALWGRVPFDALLVGGDAALLDGIRTGG